jgi:hypothetical protein
MRSLPTTRRVNDLIATVSFALVLFYTTAQGEDAGAGPQVHTGACWHRGCLPSECCLAAVMTIKILPALSDISLDSMCPTLATELKCLIVRHACSGQATAS